jgi:hypothetical protein
LNVVLRATLAALFAAHGAAQGGYTTEKHPDLGLELPRARDYEQIPTQPDEEFVVLYYAEKLPKDQKDVRAARAELAVVWIDFVEDPPPKPVVSEVPPPEEDEGRTRAEPKAKVEEQPEPPPISTLERWLDQRSPWRLGRGEPGKSRDGWNAAIHTLAPKNVLGAGAWAYVFDKPKQRTIAFIGQCAKADLPQQSKIWRYIAEHAEFSEPEGADVAKLALKYANSKLRGIDYRIKVRSKLVRGWKAEDTENFIVVSHTTDQPLLRALVRDIESIRKEYVKLFPPAGAIEAVSTVRVCKDRGEYFAYGGFAGSAGYWNSATEELVFYDAQVREKGKRTTGEENTFIVLYHEAFHQYIHYSAGELPPHSWFNEGHGDFFSGADISGGKVKRIGVNPWRIGLIQRAIDENKIVRWKDILAFEQVDYYRPDRRSICYAQGWSMIYFLRTAPVVLKHPQWSKILTTYFDALKQDYAGRLATLEAQGRRDEPGARAECGVAARKRALEVAFEGVDVGELESEWRDYIAAIEWKK